MPSLTSSSKAMRRDPRVTSRQTTICAARSFRQPPFPGRGVGASADQKSEVSLPAPRSLGEAGKREGEFSLTMASRRGQGRSELVTGPGFGVGRPPPSGYRLTAHRRTDRCPHASVCFRSFVGTRKWCAALARPTSAVSRAASEAKHTARWSASSILSGVTNRPTQSRATS